MMCPCRARAGCQHSSLTYVSRAACVAWTVSECDHGSLDGVLFGRSTPELALDVSDWLLHVRYGTSARRRMKPIRTLVVPSAGRRARHVLAGSSTQFRGWWMAGDVTCAVDKPAWQSFGTLQ